jgi:hypothetical protein
MPEEKSSPSGDRKAVIIAATITAVVGAVATILAALIGHAQGVSDASPGPTVTKTVTAEPSATVTVSASPTPQGTEGNTAPATGCASASACKTANLSVSLGGGTEADATTIDLSHRAVLLNSYYGDLQFGPSNDGTPEITGTVSAIYSIDITSSNASQQQCQTAISSDPDRNPITNFHEGLLFCAQTNSGDGIALLEETQPLRSDHILHLHEIYWPNPGT